MFLWTSKYKLMLLYYTNGVPLVNVLRSSTVYEGKDTYKIIKNPESFVLGFFMLLKLKSISTAENLAHR